MAVDKIKFQDIVKNQLPEFVQDDHPLLGEFLSQYYLSQENDGATFDLLNNIDSYVKIDNLYNLKESTGLASSISYFNNVINTSSDTNFTEGFPEKNGIIKIDDEIISNTNPTSPITAFVRVTSKSFRYLSLIYEIISKMFTLFTNQSKIHKMWTFFILRLDKFLTAKPGIIIISKVVLYKLSKSVLL